MINPKVNMPEGGGTVVTIFTTQIVITRTYYQIREVL